MEIIILLIALLYLLNIILVGRIYANELVEPSLISVTFLIVPILNTMLVIKHRKKLELNLELSNIIKFYKYLD